jgi:hypothetical protein
MSDTDPTAPPVATYQYQFIQLSNADRQLVLDELNRLGASGWMVRSFENAGGFFNILLELET